MFVVASNFSKKYFYGFHFSKRENHDTLIIASISKTQEVHKKVSFYISSTSSFFCVNDYVSLKDFFKLLSASILFHQQIVALVVEPQKKVREINYVERNTKLFFCLPALSLKEDCSVEKFLENHIIIWVLDGISYCSV